MFHFYIPILILICLSSKLKKLVDKLVEKAVLKWIFYITKIINKVFNLKNLPENDPVHITISLYLTSLGELKSFVKDFTSNNLCLPYILFPLVLLTKSLVRIFRIVLTLLNVVFMIIRFIKYLFSSNEKEFLLRSENVDSWIEARNELPNRLFYLRLFADPRETSLYGVDIEDWPSDIAERVGAPFWGTTRIESTKIFMQWYFENLILYYSFAQSYNILYMTVKFFSTLGTKKTTEEKN